MTFGVFLWLCVLAIAFASFCGALAGTLIGFYMRPMFFATGPMILPSEDEETIPLKAKRRA